VADFAVSDEKNRQLRERMEALGVREEDLDEQFIRSSGKGGQHVNKTSTCVYLRHRPTGIEVKCMAERSQSLNRFLARRELLEKVARLAGVPTAAELKREKARKQKSKRKKRARDKYVVAASDGPGEQQAEGDEYIEDVKG
jgi:protein subunit release factor B